MGLRRGVAGRIPGNPTARWSNIAFRAGRRWTRRSFTGAASRTSTARWNGRRYGYTVDTFAPPAWAREAVIYHVFVDRFTGVENRWLEPAEMEQFAGGTLAGVTEKLDYIADLGVTTLWLSPFFKTSFYHGYDTVDFYTVDPRFGTNDDVRALVDAAHARGLRVILDFVANHVGTGFAPFAAAAADPPIPTAPGSASGRSTSTATVASSTWPPCPNWTPTTRTRRYLLDAAQFWLREYDVDGYRLDYAAGPSTSSGTTSAPPAAPSNRTACSSAR
ncbi:MAG: alpha-amylase family glycosyl hydrolase [Caldilineaceae bacterium]